MLEDQPGAKACTASVVVPTRNPGALEQTLGAIASLRSARAATIEVLIVDDGSTIPVQPDPPARSKGIVRVIRREGSGNRAAARNTGACAARGDVLIFLDADCRPAAADYLDRILAAFDDPGVVATGGPIVGVGNSFWARYQLDSQSSRLRLKTLPPLTAANLSVRRDVFARCGGFDEEYRGYGFEDRDLLLRLAAVGRVVPASGAAVIHVDELRLAAVVHKMREAGERTARRFSERHQAAYRELGYARLDVGLRPWLRPVATLTGSALPRIAEYLDPLLDRGRLPYPIGKGLVRVISALSFLYGTSRRSNEA